MGPLVAPLVAYRPHMPPLVPLAALQSLEASVWNGGIIRRQPLLPVLVPLASLAAVWHQRPFLGFLGFKLSLCCPATEGLQLGAGNPNKSRVSRSRGGTYPLKPLSPKRWLQHHCPLSGTKIGIWCGTGSISEKRTRPCNRRTPDPRFLMHVGRLDGY